LDESLQPREGVGDAALVLLAELDGGKALLDHGHERLSLPGFERELERRFLTLGIGERVEAVLGTRRYCIAAPNPL
jgi:hypothetical protein